MGGSRGDNLLRCWPWCVDCNIETTVIECSVGEKALSCRQLIFVMYFLVCCRYCDYRTAGLTVTKKSRHGPLLIELRFLVVV